MVSKVERKAEEKAREKGPCPCQQQPCVACLSEPSHGLAIIHSKGCECNGTGQVDLYPKLLRACPGDPDGRAYPERAVYLEDNTTPLYVCGLCSGTGKVVVWEPLALLGYLMQEHGLFELGQAEGAYFVQIDSMEQVLTEGNADPDVLAEDPDLLTAPMKAFGGE